jgi:hypothetical protein
MEPLRSGTTATPRASQLYQNLTLDDRRKALQNDLLYTTKVSLDEFIETFVPKLPEGIKVTSDFVTQMDEDQTWNGLLLPLDADSEGNEDATFKSLTSIFDKMVQVAHEQWKTRCPKQQWSLLTAPTSTPTTPDRPSNFKPDVYFYRNFFSQTMSYSYYDMAFTAEFKKHNRNDDVVDVSVTSSIPFVPLLIRSQNMTKVIYAMRHMMAIDARRRFIFGITIENTSLRLWYANRAMLVSSIPLDIAEVETTPLFVFQLLSASIGKVTLYPGLPVVCVRIRRGYGLGSVC